MHECKTQFLHESCDYYLTDLHNLAKNKLRYLVDLKFKGL